MGKSKKAPRTQDEEGGHKANADQHPAAPSPPATEGVQARTPLVPALSSHRFLGHRALGESPVPFHCLPHRVLLPAHRLQRDLGIPLLISLAIFAWRGASESS